MTTNSIEEKYQIPLFQQVVSQVQSTAVESGNSQILFFNIDEQSWAFIESSQTILKKAPDGIEYTDIDESIKITSVMVNGYKYEGGCVGIMFFPDGSCEYSEIEIQNNQDGKRYIAKLNPYFFEPEITEIQ